MPFTRARLLAPQLWLALSLCLLSPTPVAADPGNDRYRFAPSASRQRGLTLERSPNGAELRLRASDVASADTLLLGLRVAASGPAPRIRARAGALSIEQYLDPGAHGLRWLNVTSLRAALRDGVSLTLESQDVAITSAQANLRAFENRLPFERGILILAPHPDDAEIAAFGLYASHAAETHIVTVTSGNAGPHNYRANFPSEAEHYQFKGFQRAIDSVTVPWQGGVPPERCYNLGYFDARLLAMHVSPSQVVPELYSDNRDVALYRRANLSKLLPNVSRLNSWQNLVADLAQLFATLEPGLIVMPHPLLDSHSDHQFVTVAAAEALARYTKPVTLLLYTNHAGNNRYPYGPAGSTVSLPPWNANELPVEGLYALPIDASMQRRKLFALDSMHDLRLAPEEQKQCATQALALTEDSPRLEEMDYFRRAPRAEELFFVFDRAGLGAVIQRHLEAHLQAH